MSPTKICVRCIPTGDGARCGARKASGPEANQQGNTSHLRATDVCLLNGAREEHSVRGNSPVLQCHRLFCQSHLLRNKEKRQRLSEIR